MIDFLLDLSVCLSACLVLVYSESIHQKEQLTCVYSAVSNVCMYVDMYVCRYVCMYVCM